MQVLCPLLPRTLVPVMLCFALAQAGFAAAPGMRPLPWDLRIYDDTGAPIVRPKLEAVGSPIVVSNSPETLRSVPSAAALYRTVLAQRHFRVFLHHRNGAGRPLQVGVAITNPADAPDSVEVYVGPNSQLLPLEARSTVSGSPAAAGREAMRNWFISRDRLEGNQWLHTLRPGQTRYVLQGVPPGATVTGMYDFGVRYAGSGVPGKVGVAVVACDVPPADPGCIPVLPPDSEHGAWHRRGVFAHSERRGQVDCEVSEIEWLDLAGPHEGKYSRLMQNELEAALDDPQGLNPGNYGVVYRLHVVLHNTSSQRLRVRCLLNAAGGAGFSGAALDGVYEEAARLLREYESWTYNKVEIEPAGRSSFTIEFTIPGGSSGAHRLYFWPEKAG